MYNHCLVPYLRQKWYIKISILFTDTTVHPSLQERQRQLKKARLQDSLSDRLANRPGPLELVERNILQGEQQLVETIKGNGSNKYRIIWEILPE